MTNQREVTEEQIKQFMKQYRIDKYYETSALNGLNVEKPYLELGQQILTQINNGALNPQELSAYGIKTKSKKP